jgi:hypothetical protein
MGESTTPQGIDHSGGRTARTQRSLDPADRGLDLCIPRTGRRAAGINLPRRLTCCREAAAAAHRANQNQLGARAEKHVSGHQPWKGRRGFSLGTFPPRRYRRVTLHIRFGLGTADNAGPAPSALSGPPGTPCDAQRFEPRPVQEIPRRNLATKPSAKAAGRTTAENHQVSAESSHRRPPKYPVPRQGCQAARRRPGLCRAKGDGRGGRGGLGAIWTGISPLELFVSSRFLQPVRPILEEESRTARAATGGRPAPRPQR